MGLASYNIGMSISKQDKLSHKKNDGIKCTRYSTMFGCSPNVGFKSMRLTQEIIEQLESEEDLLSTLQA